MQISKVLTLAFILLLSTCGLSQIIGGSSNGEMTPEIAEPTKLSGGGYVGDVNIMTGEYGASIPLGSVNTPSGIGYSLSLNNSSSFSFSTTQPMTEGIPYGEGWSPSIPTISVETDVFHKFKCGELENDGGIYPSVSSLKFNDAANPTYAARDESDLYWFAPTVNIPGVGSGRAVFKYVDVADEKCLVFVLNKFESPIELRFYGNAWVVKIADGTTL